MNAASPPAPAAGRSAPSLATLRARPAISEEPGTAAPGRAARRARRGPARSRHVDHPLVPLVQGSARHLGVLVVGDAGLETNGDQPVSLRAVGATAGALPPAAARPAPA